MTCRFCGKNTKNDGAHERFCSKNPDRTPPFHNKSNAVNADNPKPIEQQIVSGDLQTLKKPWLLKRIFSRNKSENKIEIVATPDMLIKDLPKWSISEKRPSKLFNKGKDFIAVVLISEVFEPKMFWAEYDGILIRTKNRAYKPPRDVRGEIFFWHVDKKEPLIDLAKATEDDAEDSFHELQMFNMAYSVGRQAGMNDWTQKMGLIMVLVIVLVLGEIALGYLMFNQFKEVKAQLDVIQTGVNALKVITP